MLDPVAQKVVGPHQWNVKVSHFTDDVLRMFIVVDIIYSPAILMAKLSLLMLYLDVFRPDRRLRYAIYFGIVFTTLFYASAFIAYCVLAIPRRGESLIGVMLSKGVASAIPLSIGQGAINVATDFYILLVPIPGVLQLQLPIRKKIGFCAIFMTGSLACLASVMGLYYRTKLKRNSDVTWQLVDVLIWVSRAKSFNLLKLSSRPSSSEKPKSSKRLDTKDIKMTLGSRVDGQGRFVNVTSVFAREEDWLKLGQAAHNPPSLTRMPSATRREWYEQMTELKRQSLSSHPPTTSKSYMQTHVRKLPIQDEETGSVGNEIHADELADGDHSNGRIDFF
ncbi:MAG: hypothetical protein LQ352_006241 [Teloschistes flavicans]|nr:MAG: hypothetical protein LQ352_006241 [Teloschistes flavicans]